uniref:Galectin n=1 Tax=Anolis carolinensis TaxID=28377 RepID=A0A803SVG2_ANOCA
CLSDLQFQRQCIFSSSFYCRFQIDFQCGSAPSPRPDVAFHFNARFDESCMVGNSFERGNWQHEQRKQDMPFRKGHPFEIRFLVTNGSFKVLRSHRSNLILSALHWIILTPHCHIIHFSVHTKHKDNHTTDIQYHHYLNNFSPNHQTTPHLVHNRKGLRERQIIMIPPLLFFLQMCILCETRGFKVAVNGHHLFDYSYRIPNLPQINQLEVEGDVTLTSIS